jgi:hypothetical protein
MPSLFTVVNEPLLLISGTFCPVGVMTGPKVMVATATATLGAMGRIAVSSTVMLVFAKIRSMNRIAAFVDGGLPRQ